MLSTMLREEESRLLKRQARKTKKPYVIESRMPNTTIRAFSGWRFSGRYETEARRDQALRELRKNPLILGRFAIEYRAKQ